MKRFAPLMLAGAVALVLTACGGGGNQAQQPAQQPAAQQPAAQQPASTPSQGADTVDTAKAEGVFKQTCAGCHGVDMQGQIGPKLADIGSRLSKDQILDVLKNGKGGGGMPAGLVQGADAENLAAWLATKK
ncbi:c-type cytochrome [Brevibacillus ginsengisoli]|uniref:c-type cytochrome n=1 Tax=Brevibacillus ginsengisoli TaxID=363854 RepID=UPI003CF492F2